MKLIRNKDAEILRLTPQFTEHPDHDWVRFDCSRLNVVLHTTQMASFACSLTGYVGCLRGGILLESRFRSHRLHSMQFGGC